MKIILLTVKDEHFINEPTVRKFYSDIIKVCENVFKNKKKDIVC